MKKEMRFYMTPAEIAGAFGTMCAVFIRMPWEGMSIIDKFTTFSSIVVLGVVAVASVELIADTARDIWYLHKIRKAQRENMDA
jgi:hypothetical protein